MDIQSSYWAQPGATNQSRILVDLNWTGFWDEDVWDHISEVAKVLTHILLFSVKEKREEIENLPSLGVLAGSNSACRAGKGVGWVLRRLRGDF